MQASFIDDGRYAPYYREIEIHKISDSIMTEELGATHNPHNWVTFLAALDEIVPFALRSLNSEGWFGAARTRLAYSKKMREVLGKIKGPGTVELPPEAVTLPADFAQTLEASRQQFLAWKNQLPTQAVLNDFKVETTKLASLSFMWQREFDVLAGRINATIQTIATKIRKKQPLELNDRIRMLEAETNVRDLYIHRDSAAPVLNLIGTAMEVYRSICRNDGIAQQSLASQLTAMTMFQQAIITSLNSLSLIRESLDKLTVNAAAFQAVSLQTLEWAKSDPQPTSFDTNDQPYTRFQVARRLQFSFFGLWTESLSNNQSSYSNSKEMEILPVFLNRCALWLKLSASYESDTQKRWLQFSRNRGEGLYSMEEQVAYFEATENMAKEWVTLMQDAPVILRSLAQLKTMSGKISQEQRRLRSSDEKFWIQNYSNFESLEAAVKEQVKKSEAIMWRIKSQFSENTDSRHVTGAIYKPRKP